MLFARYVHFGRFFATGVYPQCVVGVHPTMNERIHDNVPQLIRFVILVHNPPTHQSSDMMIPMKKDQLLFA